MYVSKQLKEKNLAEYLIYMWQVEDLIRANNWAIEELEKNVISKYPEENREELREWYQNLIDMMLAEGVKEKGHLQINKNVILNLSEVNQLLLSSPKSPFYSASYFKALPLIVEVRQKGGHKDVGEVETAFETLYGILMLKLKGEELSEDTQKAMEIISSWLSMLVNYYNKPDIKEELYKID